MLWVFLSFSTPVLLEPSSPPCHRACPPRGQAQQAWDLTVLPCPGLCGTFAPLCLACRISDDFGECCCAPYLPGGLHSLRTGMRERYHIQVRANPGPQGLTLKTATRHTKAKLLTFLDFSLSHLPGLRRARLGCPHLLPALRPLSDGAGTEDPRVRTSSSGSLGLPCLSGRLLLGNPVPLPLSHRQKNAPPIKTGKPTPPTSFYCRGEGLWVQWEVCWGGAGVGEVAGGA